MPTGTPVIPTLDSTIGILSDRNRIIKYVVRQYLTTPRNITNVHNANEISFTFDLAVVADDTVALADRVRISLVNVLKRYFPDASNLGVEVEIRFIDSTYYDILIRIAISTNSGAYSLNEDFKVNSDGDIIV